LLPRLYFSVQYRYNWYTFYLFRFSELFTRVFFNSYGIYT